MKISARDITIYAILTAVALAISVLEAQLPIPLPGVKLGLANIVTLFSLYSLGTLPSLAILVCRCILASVFGGGFSSLIFSLCGGALALTTMLFLKRLSCVTIYGVSIAGAASHGIGQITAACMMFGSISAINYLPLLLLSAPLTGTIVAYITQNLISRLKNMYKQ